MPKNIFADGLDGTPVVAANSIPLDSLGNAAQNNPTPRQSR